MQPSDTQAPGAEAPALANPQDLLTGKKLPTRCHTFRSPGGEEFTVLLQGLTYLEKSEVDLLSKQDREEAERSGEQKVSMWGPRLIARAMRNPDGTRAFPRDEEWRLFAIRLAEQYADGEISRGSNVVLDLSGWGEEAEKAAGKA